MSELTADEERALYPPRTEDLAALLEGSPAAEAEITPYDALVESQCGATDDSQPVEQYDGTLGVTTDFVAAHQSMVGQLQWDPGLADVYDNPGNVSGVRWCTGTLISNDLFLTAGHCFDPVTSGWQVPRTNGTNTPIQPAEIARRMHVNFQYQVDPDGNLRTEVEFDIEELVEYRLGGLDVAIVRLRGNPGSIFGVGRLAAGDPDVEEMLAIIGHPAGVPKRIEAGPVFKFDGHRIRYDDIDTLGGNSGSALWHSPSGRIVGVHTNGGCTVAGTGSNFGVRIERIRQESETVRRLDHGPLALAAGSHRVRQISSGRYLDAHDGAGNDFSAVTRPKQNNDTQRWRFLPVGAVYTIRQVSSGRFLDAHQNTANDFSAVTRRTQDNDTQRWVLLPVPGEPAAYTIQQLSSDRYLDAHEHSGADFSAVTRSRQENDTQRWRLSQVPGSTSYTIQQLSSGRYLDAHEHSGADFSTVTRNRQNNDTQRWELTPVAGVFTIQQVSNDQFLDAHDASANDFSAVTRSNQANDTQRWIVTHLGSANYTIQQQSTGRFLDAHEHSGADFSAVTRTRQNNDTQRWQIGIG